MMKKYILPFLAICIAFIMAGCGRDAAKSTASEPLETIEAPSATPSDESSSSVKNETEIIQDMSEREDFFTLFDEHYDAAGSGSSYTIDEMTITRRKIDEATETDNVYATITASSSAGKYTGNFHLLYSFYDVGGWYLESIELESGKLEPLSGVSETQALSIAAAELSSLGIDGEDYWIGDSYVDGNTEAVVVNLHFADDVLTTQGAVILHFYFNGADWVFTEPEYHLISDILIDGTYQCTDCLAQPQYLTVTHENGNLLIYHAQSWDGGIDPFHLREGFLDASVRSYYAADDGHTRSYYFGSDGIISYSLDNVLVGTFHRITTPTTDSNALWDAVRAAGIAYK